MLSLTAMHIAKSHSPPTIQNLSKSMASQLRGNIREELPRTEKHENLTRAKKT